MGKKEELLVLHGDSSFEQWIGWCFSHILLIGRCHKTCRIHYVLLFLYLYYWTVFSKFFSVAACGPDYCNVRYWLVFGKKALQQKVESA